MPLTMKRFALLLCLATPPVFALQDAPPKVQDPAPEAPDKNEKDDKDQGKKKEIERLKKWPELTDKAGAKLQMKRLIKPNKPESATDAIEKLIEMGPQVVPTVIKELKRSRDKKAHKRMVEVLEEICGAPHTRLLSEHFEAKSDPLRRFALYQVAHYPDPGVAKKAEAAYKKASAEKTKWEKRDRYLAALTCASAGSKAGWDDLVLAARTKWGKSREDLAMVLPVLRSDQTSQEVIDKVDGTDRQDKVNCLRLLSILGTKKAIPFVKPHLDSDDASIRVAAINACRGIVDGEAPLGDISVFTAVELAKKWKERL